MILTGRTALCLLAALILAACAQDADNQAGTACELHVAWDPYEPYSYKSSGAKPVGYDIDVINKVAGIIGCTLHFSEMAWSEVLTALEAGDVDLAVGTGYKQSRAEWSWYSESYRKEVLGLLVRAGAPEVFYGSSMDELFRQGFVFGKTTDDTYSEAIQETFERHPDLLRPRVSEEQNLLRLLDGSVDGVLIEVNVGSALARKLGVADQLEFHPLAFSAGEYRLQLSKATVTARTVVQVNAAIQQLAASGWLADALREYGIEGLAN